MTTRMLISLGLTLLLGERVLAAQSSPALTVSHQARRLEPGEAVVLVIASATPLKEVRATAFGRDIPVVQGDAPGRWLGLFGIDVETKAGRHEVVVNGLTADGAALHARHPLVVGARKFPIRQLSVDDAFVNPPASARARIEAEAKAVEAVLARVSPAPWWSGPLVTPVPGEATSGFGRRSVLNGEVRSLHAGVDFRAAEGTPVKTPARGRVALAADHYFAGKVVIVDHGLGLFSFLAHLSSISVAEGQVVEQGEVVGLSGATGRVTGPHLHWSVRLPGARVDPLSLMAVFQVESARRGVVR
jgi:murein DD-endopeptidase MepM/ murein hydrolase activator NlpD